MTLTVTLDSSMKVLYNIPIVPTDVACNSIHQSLTCEWEPIADYISDRLMEDTEAQSICRIAATLYEITIHARPTLHTSHRSR